MPTPITFTLTNAGLNAALNADTTGLTLSLTRIAIGGGKYTPAATRTALQSEFSRYALSGGDVEPNSKTLRFSAVLESPITRQVFEIGLFTSTGVLFAVASTTGADPLILVTANISYVASFGMVLSEIPAGSVTVVTDPSAPLATALIAQHVASANPHPQYAMKAAFDGYVSQNLTDFSTLTDLVTTLNQRVLDLESREEVKIGEFIITDDPRDPSTYKGYGSWRLISDTLLRGLVAGGAVGQFSQVINGTGLSVRNTHFWQRYDPNEAAVLRTIVISEDAVDVNLRTLFVAQYGQPVEGQQVHFIVNAGVLITASTTSRFAVETGLWPSTAVLSADNFGIISGRGGRGANTTFMSLNGAQNTATPSNGENGGPAIRATHPIVVNNQNVLAGGGAGGGASEQWLLNKVGAPSNTASTEYAIPYGGSGGVPFGLGGVYPLEGVESGLIGTGAGFIPFPGRNATKDGGNTGYSSTSISGLVTSTSGAGGLFGQNGASGSGSGMNGTDGDGDSAVAVRVIAGGNGGLAGVAITGPVTVIGNPVLGR